MPKIQCVSCKKIIGVTTDKFNPDIRPNGSMLDLAEPYKSRGWGQMMNWTIGTCCSELFCPLCNYPLAPSGRFTVLEDCEPTAKELEMFKVFKKGFTDTETPLIDEADAFQSCPKCGRLESEFKNRSGFVNHCRVCKVVKAE